MRRVTYIGVLGALLIALGILVFPGWTAQAQDTPQPPLIVGEVLNQQKQPVEQAVVSLMEPGNEKPLAQAQTQADGEGKIWNLFFADHSPVQTYAERKALKG